MAPSKNINSEIGNERLERSIDMLMGSFSVPVKSDREEIWERISDSIGQDKEVAIVPLWKRSLRVAAILLPLIVVTSAGLIYFMGNTQINTPMGQQVTVLLPDSSSVTLNADSHLRFNSSTWFLFRSVVLSGEALFRVKKGKTFSVEAAGTTTQVLGTVFNVFSRNSEVRINCFEGRVRVTSNNSKTSVILEHGHATKLSKAVLTQPTRFSNENAASWTNGEFQFTNEPIGKVFDELARQFAVQIVINTNTNRLYTGYFNNQSLERALDLVCQPMGLTWELNRNMVIINTKK